MGELLRPVCGVLAELYIDQRLVHLVQQITPGEEAGYQEYGEFIVAA